jgi:hypothetical protein
MGVIFRKEVAADTLAKTLADTMSDHISAALAETSPTDSAAHTQRVQELTTAAARASAKAAAQAPTTMSVNWKPFLVGVLLFFVLLAVSIYLDWKNVVDDPAVYSGMATTMLGVLVGFLGGEATGTASA